MTRFVGAQCGMMGVSDVATGFGGPDIYTYGLNEAFVNERWRGEFGLEDCWANQGYAPQEGEVLTGAQLLNPDDLRQLTHYRVVLNPLGIEDCLVTSISTTGTRVMFLSLYQDLNEGYFEKHHRSRLRSIAPHLVRAAHLEEMLIQSRVYERIQRAALDRIELAMFAVRGGRAEPLNLAAEELLLGENDVYVQGGALRASHPDSDARLQSSIEAAGGGRSAPTLRQATPIAIHRIETTVPRTGWVVPVVESGASRPGLAALAEPGCALIFLADSDQGPEIASETISQLFGLTPSEGRLAAAIATGETPREYAARNQISENTARWTLKQVQAKLGTRRQLDIASLLIRAVPGIRE